LADLVASEDTGDPHDTAERGWCGNRELDQAEQEADSDPDQRCDDDFVHGSIGTDGDAGLNKFTSHLFAVV